MDWISHLIFAWALAAILLKGEKLARIAIASLLPDVDILWQHRSEIHSPLVLLTFVLVIGFQNRTLFKPVLLGFWSHSALDIILFDNSKHAIKNMANQIVANESMAQNIEDSITRYTSADGIMLFYPLSNEKFSIILVEESYAVIASLIIIIAVLIFLGLRFREHGADW